MSSENRLNQLHLKCRHSRHAYPADQGPNLIQHLPTQGRNGLVHYPGQRPQAPTCIG
jgi:hypothetical protein